MFTGGNDRSFSSIFTRAGGSGRQRDLLCRTAPELPAHCAGSLRRTIGCDPFAVPGNSRRGLGSDAAGRRPGAAAMCRRPGPWRRARREAGAFCLREPLKAGAWNSYPRLFGMADQAGKVEALPQTPPGAAPLDRPPLREAGSGATRPRLEAGAGPRLASWAGRYLARSSSPAGSRIAAGRPKGARPVQSRAQPWSCTRPSS